MCYEWISGPWISFLFYFLTFLSSVSFFLFFFCKIVTRAFRRPPSISFSISFRPPSSPSPDPIHRTTQNPEHNHTLQSFFYNTIHPFLSSFFLFYSLTLLYFVSKHFDSSSPHFYFFYTNSIQFNSILFRIPYLRCMFSFLFFFVIFGRFGRFVLRCLIRNSYRIPHPLLFSYFLFFFSFLLIISSLVLVTPDP